GIRSPPFVPRAGRDRGGADRALAGAADHALHDRTRLRLVGPDRMALAPRGRSSARAAPVRDRARAAAGVVGMSKTVVIFDTTLRDGEQSPGCSMNLAEKLTLARQLERLGVDVIEAGFPIASDGDFEAVRAIARDVRGVSICGLARTGTADV